MQNVRYIIKTLTHLLTSISFVCVAAADNMSHTRLIRSYRGRSFRSPNCTIVEAFLALLSFPGILDPIAIGNETIVDSSFNCSNPVMEIIRETEDIFGAQSEIATIISLGAGRGIFSALPSISDPFFDRIVSLNTQISHSCEQIHNSLHHRAQNSGVYFRLNPGRDLDPLVLREWSQMALVKTHTIAYLHESVVSSLVNGAVTSLRRLAATVPLSHIGELINLE